MNFVATDQDVDRDCITSQTSKYLNRTQVVTKTDSNVPNSTFRLGDTATSTAQSKWECRAFDLPNVLIDIVAIFDDVYQ